MKAVLLVDPINSSEKLKTAAKNLGYKVIAIYTRPLTIYETQFHYTESLLKAGTDEVIFSDQSAHILETVKPYQICGAIPGIDSGVELADELAHKLHLPGNLFDLSSARRDKGKMREFLEKNGFSCPGFTICDTEKKVADFVHRHKFPLVIKTPRGAGTSHVYVCDTIESLLDGFHKIRGEENFFGEKTVAAVIEEYIGGEEYIVNTFGDGEKVHVTDMWVYEKIQTKSFKNIYYNIYSIPLNGKREIKEMGIRIAEAFGVKRGTAHIELKDDPIRGPTMIEIGARLAGARLPELMQKHTNFDPYKATIEVFTDGITEVPHPVHFDKHFGLALCPIFKEGIIKEIVGIDEIKKLESYERHDLNVKVGDFLIPTTYLTTTPLVVYLANSDRKKIFHDLEAAHQLFDVKVT